MEFLSWLYALLIPMLPCWFLDAPPSAKAVFVIGGANATVWTALHTAQVLSEIIASFLRIAERHIHETRLAIQDLADAANGLRAAIRNIGHDLRRLLAHRDEQKSKPGRIEEHRTQRRRSGE